MSLEDDVKNLARIVSEHARNNAGQNWRTADPPDSGSTAQPKIVQVVDLDEGWTSDLRYSPILVRELVLNNYAPATTGSITTDNTDIEVASTKNHLKHGHYGNGITVNFDEDSGIDGDAKAAYDDSTTTLTITVKNTSVLWSAVISAVAIPWAGAFVLTADDPTQEVGSVASITDGLADGDDGVLEQTGDVFRIHPRLTITDTSTFAERLTDDYTVNVSIYNAMRIGRRLRVDFRDDTGQWEFVDTGPEIEYVQVLTNAHGDETVHDPYDPDVDLVSSVVAERLTDVGTYTAAASGKVATENSDIFIYTHKGYQLDGPRGNGIGIVFAIDASIVYGTGSDPVKAQAVWDAGGPTLTIKVHDVDVTWQDVSDALPLIDPHNDQLLNGAFSLIAIEPTAKLGESIESVTATLSGGTGGVDWAVLTGADPIFIGDHTTRTLVADGDRVWVIWSGIRQRWELVGGTGGGSGGALALYVLTEDCDSATGDMSGITAKKANARPVSKSFDGTNVIITPATSGDGVDVWNVDPGKEYLSGQGVWVSSETLGDGYAYYEIVSANCAIYAEAP